MADSLMTHEEFASAIKAKYLEYRAISDADLVSKMLAKYPEYEKQLRPADFTINVSGADLPAGDAPDDTGVGALVSHAASGVNPVAGAIGIGKALIPEAAARAMGVGGQEAKTYGPLNTAQNILHAQGVPLQKAQESYQKGDYATAARHFIDYLLPIAGPMLDQAADRAQAGHVMAGAGDAIGLGLSLFGPKALELHSQGRAVTQATQTPLNEAVQFGQARGIPIDAATATDNVAVRGVQALADRSLAGSVVSGRAKAAQGAAMTRVGGALADAVHPTAVMPEQAGQHVAGALGAKVADLDRQATASYDAIRAAEEQAPIPVDLTAAKASLKPLYDQMRRQMPVTQQQASAGLKAIQNILEGPDSAPLSQIDRDLGAIKTIAREHGGLAKMAVQRLGAAVNAAASKGGPDVVTALAEGRAATVAKYSAADVLESLKAEPVRTINAMTAPKDAGIQQLRTVTREVPQMAPQIARAWFEDRLQQATANGGFDHGAKLSADWNKLGAQTKTVLFPKAGQVAELDHFFRLAAKFAENPNPSGTAHLMGQAGQLALLWENPLVGMATQVGGAGLAALLHNPAAVRLLTRGLSLKLGGAPVAAQVAVQAQLLRTAREMGLTAAGAAAGAQSAAPSAAGATPQ